MKQVIKQHLMLWQQKELTVFVTRCNSLIGKPFSEFAIPCMPNLTVIPKDKSGVILDKKNVFK